MPFKRIETEKQGTFRKITAPVPSYTPPTKQRSLTADKKAEDLRTTNMYTDYAQARKGEVPPTAPSITAINPYLARGSQIKPKESLATTFGNIGQEIKTNIGLTPKERLEKIMIPLKGAQARWVGTSTGIAQTGKEALQFISERDKGLLPKLLPRAAQDAQKAEEKIQAFQQQTAPITNYGANLKGLDKTAFETGQQLTSLGMTAISPVSSLLTTSIGAGGQKTRELEKAGASEKAQRIGGAASGATEFGSEILSDMLTFKMLKGQGSIRDYLLSLGIETAGEMATQAVDPYINLAAIPEYELPTLKDQVKEIGQAGFSALTTSILIGGLANGVGTVRTAIKNPTRENIQKAVENTVQDMEQKGTPIDRESLAKFYQEQAQMTEPTPQAEVNPNLERFKTQQAIEQRKAEEAQAGQFTPIENQYFQPEVAKPIAPLQAPAPQTQPITPTQQETAPIEPQASERYITVTDKGVSKILDTQTNQIQEPPKGRTWDTENAQAIADIGSAQQVKPTLTLKPKLEAKVTPKIEPKAKIEPSLKTTLSEDIGIKDEAEVRKMIVRAETLKDDIKAIKQIAPEEVSALAKYEKLIDEVFEKGMSRASKNQISRLIATEQSIKPLKEKYKQQIAEVKEQAKLKQQEKDLKRKQSTIGTKLLKVSKEMKSGKLQPEFQKVADEMFGNIDTMAKSISSKKLIELNNTLDNITELEEQGIPVDEELRKSVERLNRKQIVDLTIEEKQDLLDLAMHLKHLNTTKNKALTFKKNTDIKQIAKGIANDLLIKPSRKAKKAIKTDTIVENKGRLEFITSFVGRPALTIRNLMYEVGRANENSKAVQLADEILDRANVELKNKRSLTKMLNDKIGNFHKLASSKAWNKVQDSGFKSGEKVYLKLALNDANVLESLKKMGYRRKTSLSPTKITKAEIENIKLNADEQKVYNAASDFFEETYNLLNEAYLLQNNFELKRADKGKYLPKKVSDMTIREELGQVMLPGGLKNTGVIQARKGTLNELILPDIMDIYQRQIDISTKYNAYTNLVQDVSKVFSKPELRIALRTEYGQDQNGKSIVENYMNDLFQDLQGTKQAKRTKLEDALRTIRTKAAPAILSFRATTPMIQTASLPMAFTELSAKNIARGLAGKGGFKEAMQYNERANARAEGRIDRELAESKVNAFTNFGLKAIQAVDKATVGKLWNATKYQVAEETGLSGEKLLEATSKRFDRVLDTQPNYTTADRSMTMRSQSEVDKALTMFSSAKSSVLNELKRGYIKGKYTGDYSQLAKASAGLTTSIFMMSAISNGLKKLEGDDEKFTEALMKRTLGALPLLDIVTSVMQGYDISNVGIDTIEDLGKAFTSTIDLIIDTATDKQIDERKLVKTFWDTVDASALMLGVPVETLRNDIKLAVNASRNEELKVLFKRYTDPLNKTELYKQIASPTSEKALQGLLKQLKNVDTDEKKLITNLRSKLKEGETTPERIELVLKQIKPNK